LLHGMCLFHIPFLMLAIGILIILHQDLYFEKFFTDLLPLPFITKPTQYINILYFVGSAINALRFALFWFFLTDLTLLSFSMEPTQYQYNLFGWISSKTILW
jgi:hypothetical protein